VNLVLDDGEIVTGLPRREEGALMVLADFTGKEISVPKAKVKETLQTDTSPMPENFDEIMNAEEFNHLLAFLLSKGSGKKE